MYVRTYTCTRTRLEYHGTSCTRIRKRKRVWQYWQYLYGHTSGTIYGTGAWTLQKFPGKFREVYYGGCSVSGNQLGALHSDCLIRHCQLNGRNLFGIRRTAFRGFLDFLLLPWQYHLVLYHGTYKVWSYGQYQYGSSSSSSRSSLEFLRGDRELPAAPGAGLFFAGSGSIDTRVSTGFQT